MKDIHVNRNGESLGQFDLQEIMEGLASGKFQPGDLAWKPGMAEWTSLGKFPDLDARPESQKNAPPGDLSVPAEAGSLSETGDGRDGPAWEKRAERGFFSAMLETVKAVLMSPAETFSNMKTSGGLASPLLFYGILGCVAGFVSLVYQALLEIGMGAAGVQAGDEAVDPAIAALGSGIGLGVGAVLVPIFVLIGIFIASGVNHLLLMLVGAKPKDFETTFRVCAYGYGATSVLQLVPGCGSIIASVWGIVVVIIGFAKAHETTTGKSALAVLLPIIACVGLAIVAIMAAIAIPAAMVASEAAGGQ